MRGGDRYGTALTPCPSPKGRGDGAGKGDRHLAGTIRGMVAEPVPFSTRFVLYTVLALALFPTSFFMRMVYTESLFLFLVLLTFVAMQRNWPLAVIAVIAGTATATRSVGVASFFR